MTDIVAGDLKTLVIDGVFEGMAGVLGAYVSFVPNLDARKPVTARGGLLAGVPVLLNPVKEPAGPFWTSRYEVVA